MTNHQSMFSNQPGTFIPTEKMVSFKQIFQQKEPLTISPMSNAFLSVEETEAFQKAFRHIFKKDEGGHGDVEKNGAK